LGSDQAIQLRTAILKFKNSYIEISDNESIEGFSQTGGSMNTIIRRMIYLFIFLYSLHNCVFANDSQLSVKKVLYIDSYHEGYQWSDGITDGIRSVISTYPVQFVIHRMDTKNNTSDEFMHDAAIKAKQIIEQLQPDVVIASDDNASKHVIVPFFKNSSIPFVFCGINWDETIYGYPFKNVTGMVEVGLLEPLLNLLKQYAKGPRIGYLSADVLTARKEATYYKKMFNLKLIEIYVKDLASWQSSFMSIQNQVDMLIMGNPAGIKDFNETSAKAFVLKHVKIPIGAIYDFIMSYALFGYTKIAEEQGEWAAQTAIEILKGRSPQTIPITQNKKGKLYINMAIAKKLSLMIDPDLLENAKIIW